MLTKLEILQKQLEVAKAQQTMAQNNTDLQLDNCEKRIAETTVQLEKENIKQEELTKINEILAN